MRKAFLIGFKYDKEKKLPGITVDLYQVYSFLKKNGWKDEEISVFTDIDKDEETEILKIAILEKTVDSNILSFIGDLKERKQYIFFNYYQYYTNFNSFFIKKEEIENCFLYYTGHFENGNIILPNNSLISIQTFLSNLNIYKEVILIMDCCENKIKLPFVLHNKLYRFENNNFFKSKIICITSSLENENSITSRSGSFFTRHLFNILDDSLKKSLEDSLKKSSGDSLKKSLGDISKELKNKFSRSKIKQTANISSSYPNLFVLFPWFYSVKSLLQINLFPDYLEITSI